MSLLESRTLFFKLNSAPRENFKRLLFGGRLYSFFEILKF